MKYLRKPPYMAVWKLVLIDILLVGLILVIFAFFHHALPAMLNHIQNNNAQLSSPTPSDPVVPSTQPEESTIPQDPSETVTLPMETTEPDNRTEWQKKFEDQFTDEVVITDNSYSSPEVSITIDTVSIGEGYQKVTYHVADIYVASLENFFTYTAHGQMKYFDTQDVKEMIAESNAIVAISGDFLTYQKSGFLVRNGQTYVADRTHSICVLYPDGTMETYDRNSYSIDEIMEKNPVQVWSFGPVLLDENGMVREKYEVSEAVGFRNPRSAIGYFEPGHYCFVVVDGRQDGYSRGMYISELAKIFEDLGCASAYNLDGGGSAVMLFDQERYSSQSNGGRALGDILLITDKYYRAANGEDS